jgi:hypothetical protein
MAVTTFRVGEGIATRFLAVEIGLAADALALQ